MDEKTTRPQEKRQKKPKIPRKITEKYLYNSGLYYLQRYPASVKHFKSVMTRKIKKSITHHKTPTLEEAQNQLDKVAEQFIELGYLNDNSYALALVRSLRNRGSAKANILRKLQIKGLNKDLILQCLERIDEEQAYSRESDQSAELHAAITFARKKRLGPFARHQDTPLKEDPKAMRRTLGAFARAGFAYDIVQKILEMPAEDAPL